MYYGNHPNMNLFKTKKSELQIHFVTEKTSFMVLFTTVDHLSVSTHSSVTCNTGFLGNIATTVEGV